MKLGVIAPNLMEFEFEEGLRHASEMGFQAVEVGGLGLWPRKVLRSRQATREQR